MLLLTFAIESSKYRSSADSSMTMGPDLIEDLIEDLPGADAAAANQGEFRQLSAAGRDVSTRSKAGAATLRCLE